MLKLRRRIIVPLYEYYCPQCSGKFELLRPLMRMEEPASCPQGHPNGQRMLSVFAAVTTTSEGETFSLNAGGGCACGGACSCGSLH